MKLHYKNLALGLVLISTLSACMPLVIGGAVTVAALDRRSSGSYVDDQTLSVKALSISRKFPDSHFNVVSYNRSLLITGEASTEAVRQAIATQLQALPNVKDVYNYSVVAPSSTMVERSNDTWITSKVHTNLLNRKGLNSANVKVVTERGVTYLMGLLTRQEAQLIADYVSQTAGVSRVVTLFELIPDSNVPNQNVTPPQDTITY